jgi:hypothetical protein
LRTTAALRGLLILDLAERHLKLQRQRFMQAMKVNGAEILDCTEDHNEMTVTYREQGYHKEAIFVRSALEAELDARMRMGPRS